MNKILEVKDLVISFKTSNGKVQAVRDIDFDVYKGETLAIVGESGSGKSVTSRAIMGILAGNSIVENGEILYDGQDLLSISEDDFHKIRGDRIAMIFQDPLSSLNPIMKVGKQLTEAMVLKGSASQKRARNQFNKKLALLKSEMDEALIDGTNDKEIRENNNKLKKTFDSFCVQSTILERKYRTAERAAIEAVDTIKDILFLNELKKFHDAKDRLKNLLKVLDGVYNVFLVRENDINYNGLLVRLNGYAQQISKKSNEVSPEVVSCLGEIKAVLEGSLNAVAPNFFTLGYYVMRNPDEDLAAYEIPKLNKMTREYIDKEFMFEFKKSAIVAIKNSYEKSLEKKKEVIQKVNQNLAYFDNAVLDKDACSEIKKTLITAVNESINRLSVRKNNFAYTFKASLSKSIKAYFRGTAFNPKEQARFDRQTEKYNKIVQKGKTPDWEVAPAALIDLDLAKTKIKHVALRLAESYNKDIETACDFEERCIELIDFLKEQASAFTHKMTKHLAKIKAIKLMEEVGIPEPRIRFRQYPFQLSGGMRQRIVIAIALAADPDILICDEPTTALDVTIQSQILELINKIKNERGLSVIFITHDLGVVANMADRIAVMYAGKIVELGTSEDVFYDPRHPYTRALLSSMPDLETKEKLESIPGTPPNMIYPPKGDAFAERNKYALEIDFEMQPPMFKISDTHYAATWLLHPDAPKVELPKIIADRIARSRAEEGKPNAK